MKSLEIADKLYEDIKRLCEYYINGRWNLEKEKFSTKVNNTMFDLIKTLQKDKQDLEVLEIIRKKKVDVRLLAIYVFIPSSDEEKLKNYNKHCKHVNHELTMEELLKLKQWLEENKDENI